MKGKKRGHSWVVRGQVKGRGKWRLSQAWNIVVIAQVAHVEREREGGGGGGGERK